MLIVLFGWVLFRSANLSYALSYIEIMVGISKVNSSSHPWGLLLGNRDLFLLAIGGLIVFFKMPENTVLRPTWWSSAWSETLVIKSNTQLLMLFITTLTLLTISIMGMLSVGYSPFLYFRF